MTALEVLIKQLDEKVESLKEYLAEGRVENFEEYKKICGEIRGLLIARGNVLDLRRNLEESDD